MGTQLNAIYLEATHQNVMECVNDVGAHPTSLEYFKKKDKYPRGLRLNYEQTVHVVRFIAQHYMALS